MSCFNPCRSFYMGTKPNGKEWRIFVRDHHTQAVAIDPSGHRAYFDNPDDAFGKGLVSYTYDEVPCGRCLACRLQYASEKAAQCLMEMDTHEGNCWFLTLTYDDAHIPMHRGHATLDYSDVQRFFKRLRKFFPFRYMVSGEYGSMTFRPHYHAIIFGGDIPDLYHYGNNKLGQPYFVSKWLNGVWKNGNVTIGAAEKDSCGYVARYSSKSYGYDKMLSLCETFGLQRPFLRVSKCPPLGREFAIKHAREFLANGSVSVSTPKGGVTVPCIRSVSNFLKKEFPVEFEALSMNKRFSLELSKASIAALGLDWYDYLEEQGKALEGRTKSIMKRSF